MPESHWDLWSFIVPLHKLALDLGLVSKLCVPSLIDQISTIDSTPSRIITSSSFDYPHR